LPLRRYKAKRVKTRCYQERVVTWSQDFRGKGSSLWNIFGFDKSRHILLSDSANCTVLRAVILTQYRHVTDGRTDRQTDGRKCHSWYSSCNASIAARCKNGPKIKGSVPLSFWGEGAAESPSNVAETRPTSMPSFILIHPTFWPLYTNVKTGEDNGAIA